MPNLVLNLHREIDVRPYPPREWLDFDLQERNIPETLQYFFLRFYLELANFHLFSHFQQMLNTIITVKLDSVKRVHFLPLARTSLYPLFPGLLLANRDCRWYSPRLQDIGTTEALRFTDDEEYPLCYPSSYQQIWSVRL